MLRLCEQSIFGPSTVVEPLFFNEHEARTMRHISILILGIGGSLLWRNDWPDIDFVWGFRSHILSDATDFGFRFKGFNISTKPL